MKLSVESRTRLRTLIAEFKLQAVEEQIFAEAVECVVILRGEPADMLRIGNSRYGGLPDLPETSEWPRFGADYYRPRAYLEFIMQINLAELPIGSPAGLPHRGMLYFFATFEGEGRVLFHPTNSGLIRQVHPPADETLNETMEDLKPHCLKFTVGVDVPNVCTPLGTLVEEKISVKAANQLDFMAMHALCGEHSKAAGQLFGSPFGIYEDYRELAAITSLGLRRHRWKDEIMSKHSQAILNDQADWRLLWKIESDMEVGACFGDAGAFNVMIRDCDLGHSDFSNIVVELETT